MISDVLFDAGEDIRRYLADMPDVYTEVLPEVLLVLAAMDALREKLDTPPTWLILQQRDEKES